MGAPYFGAMKLISAAVSMLLVLAVTIGDAVTAESATTEKTTYITSFDGTKGNKWQWHDTNDPVMGGASTSTFKVVKQLGVFNGTCAIVRSLKAPGFAMVEGYPSTGQGVDVSKHINGSLKFVARSSTPLYGGFKVAFDSPGIPHTSRHGGGSFKSNFFIGAPQNAWTELYIPFNSFSYDWSPFTGKCDTKDPTGKQHRCCSSNHTEVCPTAGFLSNVTGVSFWAEGVKGDFHLEVKWVGACSGYVCALKKPAHHQGDPYDPSHSSI